MDDGIALIVTVFPMLGVVVIGVGAEHDNTADDGNSISLLRVVSSFITIVLSVGAISFASRLPTVLATFVGCFIKTGIDGTIVLRTAAAYPLNVTGWMVVFGAPS